MKWEEVIQPRDAGGLHIRNGFRASQAKQYWRLITGSLEGNSTQQILPFDESIANGAGLRFGRIEPEAEMDYRGGDEFVKLQTASEENSMTGRAYNTEVEEQNILTLAEFRTNEAKKKKN